MIYERINKTMQFSLSLSLTEFINRHFNTHKHACGKLWTPTYIPGFIDGRCLSVFMLYSRNAAPLRSPMPLGVCFDPERNADLEGSGSGSAEL